MIIHPDDNVEIREDGHKYALRDLKCGENVIARKKAQIFTPGEMAVVKLSGEVLSEVCGDLTVCVEGEQ